ncbi:hypothetical protein TPHA_0I02570 [Tetrapisispora phaffii CBS 4417]|uniref:Rho-GAP domain-containing protein n=1 Tax=Tetrapisispora phaffii (strain ATCC 24235 / CBS 4417 / NBRC 1672 / NRRL Y-8282 / UCD 70-5) TaxID=1071381 RepID=G8BXY0_TETPH|nr:hypothetical protein TPHA_0I02570 [Tetrapisispora phaffii CBS 4417]CCE64758.1 hypothetical protein TPHA_0I02570 [Tetrapisispora phaffii CBS 4417]
MMDQTSLSSKVSNSNVGDANGEPHNGGEQGTLLDREEIKRIMDSDVAINALLAILKQSLLTCEEFTKYVKKKYMFEQENVEELSKQYKHFFTSTSNTSPSLRRCMRQILQFDGKLANVKQSYVTALIKMYEELSSLLLTMTKMRKSIKEKSRRLEKEVSDAIHVSEKAQMRYNSLCQDWDKLRMTDPTKTKLTLRGSKTTKEQEEDLTRKIDAADIEYKQRVDHSTSLRTVFLNKERPQIVSELRDLILEIDTAMTIQLQKYCIWTENLALNVGVTVLPLDPKHSMKSIVLNVTNEKDLYNYLNKYNQNGKESLLSNKSLVPVPYKKHPSMVKDKLVSPHGNSTFSVNNQRNLNPINTNSKDTGGFSSPNTTVVASGNSASKTSLSSSTYIPTSSVYSPNDNNNKYLSQGTSDSATDSPHVSGLGIQVASYAGAATAAVVGLSGSNNTNNNLNTLPSKKYYGNDGNEGAMRTSSFATGSSAYTDDSGRPISHIQHENVIPAGIQNNFKTFGIPLEKLLEYEQDSVPTIVKQCVYVIDTYGLQVEGIYRKSANVLDVGKLKDEIDKDPSNISMILPPKDYTDSDLFVVSSLLKAFFSALPETLIPSSCVPELKVCLSIEDLETRKNYMHGLIYKFPDAQYWTLRTLIFHLKRVMANEAHNRMNLKGLSIIWGPTIVPQNDEDINDINFQIGTMEIIFAVADQAFESEE